jgi:hypothetical protein
VVGRFGLRKRHFVIVAALCLAAGAVVAAWLARLDVAISLLGVLAAVSVALLLDIRHRQQVHGRKLKAHAASMESLGAREENVARAQEQLGRDVGDLTRSVETSMTTITRAVTALSATVEAASDDASRRAELDQARTAKQLRSLEYEPVVDTQAVLQLLALIQPRAAMPALGGWAMDARTVLEFAHLLLHKQPKLVVELGSGASTVWSGTSSSPMVAGWSPSIMKRATPR